MATATFYKNLAISEVAVAPIPRTTGTLLTLLLGTGVRFPLPPFQVTVFPRGTYPDPSNAEIVKVTGIFGDTCIIERAQEGTTPRAILVGDIFANTITKSLLDELSTGEPGPPGPAGAVLVVRETPVGVIDGVNALFLLVNTPVVGSEQVFLNGLLQDAHNVDYGINGTTITFLVPPHAGDRVLVTYVKEN